MKTTYTINNSETLETLTITEQVGSEEDLRIFQLLIFLGADFTEEITE